MLTFPFNVELSLVENNPEIKRKTLILRGITFLAILVFVVLFFTLPSIHQWITSLHLRRPFKLEESLVLGGVGIILFVYKIISNTYIPQKEKHKFGLVYDEVQKKLVFLSPQPTSYPNTEIFISEILTIKGSNSTTILDESYNYLATYISISLKNGAKYLFRISQFLDTLPIQESFTNSMALFYEIMKDNNAPISENFLKKFAKTRRSKRIVEISVKTFWTIVALGAIYVLGQLIISILYP